MLGKLKNLWAGIPDHDRKLIRLTAMISGVILVASLVLLYMMTKDAHPAENPAHTEKHPHSDSTATDSAKHKDSISHDMESSTADAHEESLSEDSASQILAGLDSFDTEAHRDLSLLLARSRDYDRSLQHAERVAPWLEHDLEFQGLLGSTYLSAGKPAEAIPHLQKIVDKGSATPEQLNDLALAKYRGESQKSGLESIRSALAKHPNSPLLQTTQASMMGDDKDNGRKADSLFQSILKKNPLFAEAHYQYSRFLMNQGNYASSLKAATQARKLNPLDPRVHARYGMACFYTDRDAEASDAYRTALAMNPKDYNTWYNLGELEFSLANESDRPSVFAQKTREALEAYLTTLSLRPRHFDAQYRTGVILNANQQYREAIQHLQVALEGNPHSVPVLLQIATAWEALDAPGKALEIVQQAYSIDPFHKVSADLLKRLSAKNRKAS